MKPGIPEAWTPLLQDEFAAGSFARLQQFLTGERSVQEILPCEDQVFAAFESVAPDDVRVVILGQDPYPTPGHAHGLSFSVLPGVRLPGSLRNIVRELTDDLGIPRPDHGHLVAWARQGVFLLNCVLTVEAGKPGSHRGRGWEEFTDGVLRKLSATGPRKVFLLWGNDARKKAGLIDGDRHCVLESAHPSPLSAWQGFLGSRPFSKANQALISFGREPIDWRLPPLDQPA